MALQHLANGERLEHVARSSPHSSTSSVDALFTVAEKAKETASLAQRGGEAAAQHAVGKSWEPPQLPKSY